jgi:hypothetical protein
MLSVGRGIIWHLRNSPGWKQPRDDLQEALRWVDKFADQKLSFTDCISFALMSRYRIQTAFGFDRTSKSPGLNFGHSYNGKWVGLLWLPCGRLSPEVVFTDRLEYSDP